MNPEWGNGKPGAADVARASRVSKQRHGGGLQAAASSLQAAASSPASSKGTGTADGGVGGDGGVVPGTQRLGAAAGVDPSRRRVTTGFTVVNPLRDSGARAENDSVENGGGAK